MFYLVLQAQGPKCHGKSNGEAKWFCKLLANRMNKSSEKTEFKMRKGIALLNVRSKAVCSLWIHLFVFEKAFSNWFLILKIYLGIH